MTAAMRTALLVMLVACATAKPRDDLERDPDAKFAPRELGARMNYEGVELFDAGKYPEATRKFRDAVARVPESKYFFNLCMSLWREGKHDEALHACVAVAGGEPRPELQAKTDRLVERLRVVVPFSNADFEHVPFQSVMEAARVNEDGIALAQEGNYAAATPKFRAAAKREAEPAYFYNLCMSLWREGKLGDALLACEGVGKNTPKPALQAKTKRLVDHIRNSQRSSRVEPSP